LVTKPNINTNWISYAVALYLNKNLPKTLEVIASFEKCVADNKEKLKR
jgi:hypothetical protein